MRDVYAASSINLVYVFYQASWLVRGLFLEYFVYISKNKKYTWLPENVVYIPAEVE